MPNLLFYPEGQIPDGPHSVIGEMVDKTAQHRNVYAIMGFRFHWIQLLRVVAMEKLGENVTVEEVQKRDDAGLIERNLINAPLKDTVTVPDGGYTIIRFHATNPGYWILHCHLEFHAEMGMAMLFQVGEKSDMLPVPDNFPTCGDYSPDS
ncbi:hypothetical protein JTB14_006832 [Gonioctena quinquepunctata]|nr:hypothetical protein JTB14_006832 [Gonioctena quinquepunctata]